MLSLEESGAYGKIIDLLYLHGGSIDDDATWLCGELRCDPRVWKRIRARLIEINRITVVDGQIYDDMTTLTLQLQPSSGVAAAQVERTHPPKSGAKSKENKELASQRRLEERRGDKKERGEALPRPARSLDDDPLDIAFKAYNDMASSSTPPLPTAQSFNKTRRASLAKRLAECGGLPGWEVAIAKVAASGFCHGDNDRGWVADLDFMLQQKSFTRLMEGKYDDRRPNGQAASSKPGSMADGFAKVRAVIAERERRELEGFGEAGEADDGGVP